MIAFLSSNPATISAPVILSAAPRSSVLHEMDGRGVEGPRECRQRECGRKAFSPSSVKKTPSNGMAGDTPSGFEFPRLHSGFRLRAQTPAKRLNFDAHSPRLTPGLDPIIRPNPILEQQSLIANGPTLLLMQRT